MSEGVIGHETAVLQASQTAQLPHTLTFVILSSYRQVRHLQWWRGCYHRDFHHLAFFIWIPQHTGEEWKDCRCMLNILILLSVAFELSLFSLLIVPPALSRGLSSQVFFFTVTFTSAHPRSPPPFSSPPLSSHPPAINYLPQGEGGDDTAALESEVHCQHLCLDFYFPTGEGDAHTANSMHCISGAHSTQELTKGCFWASFGFPHNTSVFSCIEEKVATVKNKISPYLLPPWQQKDINFHFSIPYPPYLLQSEELIWNFVCASLCIIL